MRWRVYWMAFKTSLTTKLEYRADFYLGILGSFGLQAAGLGSLWVVLAQSPVLSGWSGKEVALLFGLTTMAQGLSELLFNHIWYVPAYIIRGQIDRLLTYPVKSLPFFLLTSPEMHAIGNMTGGLIIFCLAGHALNLPWWCYAMLPFWMACGSFVHTSFLVVCAGLSFRIMGQKMQHFFIVNTLLQATRYPLGVFPAAMKFLLLILIPLGTAAYLPMGYVLKGFSPWEAFAAPLAAATVCTWIAFQAWEYGLKRYESTGS
jgi:ABC-2 type transport system permease protein